MITINGPRLRDAIESLAQYGGNPPHGITRSTFSPEYEAARQFLKDAATAAGLTVYDDAVGNLFVRVGPPGGRCIMSGSHIDTVPGGGPLDGAYGVLAAIEVAQVLKERGISLPLAFEAAAFVEEEGRFYDILGSKAVSGQLTWAEIASARDANGILLTDAMRACGFDPEKFESAKRTDIAAYVELHIEQGPVLEAHGVPIGVVDEITGGRQIEYIFTGETGHAGTVPMNLRRDAMMGALDFMYSAREMVLREGTKDRVRLTFGVVSAGPGFPSRIPNSTRIVQEIRDFDQALLDRLTSQSVAIAEGAARDARLDLEWREICAAVPAKMHASVLDHIAAGAKEFGLATLQMPSGAGHDAQVIATIAPSGMIFVPSRGGVSHREDEWTDFELLEQGANVLLSSVLRLIEQHGQA